MVVLSSYSLNFCSYKGSSVKISLSACFSLRARILKTVEARGRVDICIGNDRAEFNFNQFV